MTATAAFFGILGALAIGAMSPGPSFVFVARTAIALSRRDGVAAAFGMGIGGVIFAGLALVGLHALLAEVGWLYAGLKLAGGAYLLYLGFRLWRGAGEPMRLPTIEASKPRGIRRAVLLGLGTQLANPKTAFVYGGIFAALLPIHPPLWLDLALLPLVFLIECGWYSVVAVAFSAARPRSAYLRSKGWIDRIAGTVLGLLGAKLVLETARPG
jgi:threonine/homoserine/homoserine lactone efflux protein